MSEPNEQALLRWRLILGRYAQKQIKCNMPTASQRMERALDFLYGPESNRLARAVYFLPGRY